MNTVQHNTVPLYWFHTGNYTLLKWACQNCPSTFLKNPHLRGIRHQSIIRSVSQTTVKRITEMSVQKLKWACKNCPSVFPQILIFEESAISPSWGVPLWPQWPTSLMWVSIGCCGLDVLPTIVKHSFWCLFYCMVWVCVSQSTVLFQNYLPVLQHKHAYKTADNYSARSASYAFHGKTVMRGRYD